MDPARETRRCTRMRQTRNTTSEGKKENHRGSLHNIKPTAFMRPPSRKGTSRTQPERSLAVKTDPMRKAKRRAIPEVRRSSPPRACIAHPRPPSTSRRCPGGRPHQGLPVDRAAVGARLAPGEFRPPGTAPGAARADPVPAAAHPGAHSGANRVQKVLETANIKLGDVATDVLGASGRAMLRRWSAGSPRTTPSCSRVC